MLSREQSNFAPSRRSLGALIAGSAAAVTLTSLPSLAGNDADHEVAELTRLYDAAMVRNNQSEAAYAAAEERLKRPLTPEALFEQTDDPLARSFRSTPYQGRSWYGDAERISLLRSWKVQDKQTEWWKPVLARREEVLLAYDRWMAAIEAAEVAAGLPAAEDEYAAAWKDELKPVRMRILELRSTTPSAMRLKVRAYIDVSSDLDWRAGLDEKIDKAIEEEGGPWEDAMAMSILRDVVLATTAGRVA